MNHRPSVGVFPEGCFVKRTLFVLVAMATAVLAAGSSCSSNSDKPSAQSSAISASPSPDASAPNNASPSAVTEKCPNIVFGYKLDVEGQDGQLQVGDPFTYPELENQELVIVEPASLSKAKADDPTWKMNVTLAKDVQPVGLLITGASGTTFRAGTSSNPITAYAVEAHAKEYAFFAYKEGLSALPAELHDKLPPAWDKHFPGCKA